MSSLISAKGDTWSLIARRSLGDDTKAAEVASANPGVMEPIPTGTSISIPDASTQPRDQENATGVEVYYDSVKVTYFTEVTLTRLLDGFSTMKFTIPFDLGSEDMRRRYKPLEYKSVWMTAARKTIFSGRCMGVDAKGTSKSRTLVISAYAWSAIISDCSLPASAYPMSFESAGLETIVKTAARPFGLEYTFIDGSDNPLEGYLQLTELGAPFEEVSFKPGQTILSVLTKFTKQRNLLIRDGYYGDLIVFKNSVTGPSVARLTEDDSPVVEVTPRINHQQFFSHISGFGDVTATTSGDNYTKKVFDGNRFHSFGVKDAVGGGLKDAVNANIDRMYFNAIQYGVTLDTWRDPQGTLWREGTFLSLNAPSSMIYDYYKFQIRSVSFLKGKSEQCKLMLTIPTKPERLPWDE